MMIINIIIVVIVQFLLRYLQSFRDAGKRVGGKTIL